MMLVTANLDLADYTEESVDHELPLLWRHAATLMKRRVDRGVGHYAACSRLAGRLRTEFRFTENSRG